MPSVLTLRPYEVDEIVDLLQEVQHAMETERLIDDDLKAKFKDALALLGVYDDDTITE